MRFILLLIIFAAPALAQPGPGGPPAVGTVVVKPRPVTETTEFVGRIQATDKVDIVSRVTAFIEARAFTEGAEVQQGDLLYRLERGPFEADLQVKQAAAQQMQAMLRNATITLNRAQALLNTPAGHRSTVDDAMAQQENWAAQLLAQQAQTRASQINLNYTEIRAPIAGRISRSALAPGNVVTPGSGPLATIVSQDPMYVTFPVSVRALLDLRARYADKGGFAAVAVRVKLPDGKPYAQGGRLDYVDPSVAANTDTITLRATIPNPDRALIDGAFVTVAVAGLEPIQALAVPRSAVLADQQGNYVYVVDKDTRAQQRRVQLGQSTPDTAVVLAGLTEGETVIIDGLQRVRPGAPVAPAQPPAKP